MISPDVAARFHASLGHETEAGCWIRSTAPTPRGYSQIRDRGVRLGAHRVAYEIYRAEIPEGLVLDHLCRNTACVNPWHLDPVPHGVNILRGDSPQALVGRLGICQRGHATKGYCVECDALRQRKVNKTDAHKAYIREYMRGYRARKRALNQVPV